MKKILVVDDEEDIREIYNRILTTENYDVRLFGDSLQALDSIKTSYYDLVIADIKMPGIDGIELLESVKELQPNTDVIIATGYPATETAIKALRSGAFDYIVKPFTVEELLITIKRCFERQKLSAENIVLNKLTTLYEVSKAVSLTTDLNFLMDLIISCIVKVLTADGGKLFLINKDLSDLNNLSKPQLSDFILKKTLGVVPEKSNNFLNNEINELLKTLNAVVIIDKVSLNNLTIVKDENSLPYLFLPLSFANKVVGAMFLWKNRSNKYFSLSDKEILTIFGEQVTALIRDTQLYLKLQNNLKELEIAYQKLRVTQEQLLRSEKLSAVGELAAGVAHEINNPLATILGYIEVLNKTLPEETKFRRPLEVMEKEILRMAKIVRSLLDFSRHGNQEILKEVDINQVILDTLTVLEPRYFADGKVKLNTSFSASLPKIVGDRGNLQQVFLNLILNACQSMQKGGELTINSYILNKDNSICLEFIDNGVGINKENLNKIFDPFFTTKDIGQGTGLGLSLSYGIVKKHNGDIIVESEENKGSVFKVILPTTK